jgi:hypothetical protein
MSFATLTRALIRGRVGQIRPATPDDIPQVAALRSRVFSWRQKDSAAARETALQRVFFGNPFHDETLPSLVCENDRGGIVGFIGVSGRSLRWQGTEVRAAVPTGFMVDPDSRGMAGVRLLRRLLDGPQDITFADSPNQTARRLMEHLGGVTAPNDSLFWVRPLRPVRYMVGQIRNGGLLFSARLLARPVASAVDALATRYAQSPFYLKDPGSREEPLTAADLVRCLTELGSACSPSPSYAEAALSWLLASLARGPRAGALRQALVRSSTGEVIGWYIRFINRHGTSDVVQMGARKERYGDLLDHVFWAAWQEGAVAVSGRVQPPFLETLGQKGCVFSTNGPPVLIHSRHAELLRDVQQGRAFLSRLEGEWWMIHLSEG